MDSMERETNTFSEEGRIRQVEYAIKSISSAGPVIGLRCADGVVLIGKSTDDSVSLTQDEKIYAINRKTVGIVGGLYADSNLLVNYLRAVAQDYLMKFDTEMTPHQIGRSLSKIKQKFTQGGGMRPFGVSFLLGGYERGAYRLYSTDPSGTLSEYNAHTFGDGDKLIFPVLDEHSCEHSIEEGIKLAFRGISAVSEGTAILPHTISCAVICRINEEQVVRHLTQVEITEYLKHAKPKTSTE
ncbi:20S proteasome subunit alpha 3 [Nematocida minor]|uniref:20S proteasome subunit alpha 3 n=1 Tax=Nematocida minor TaxID=1912983 RepID=UPI00221EF9C5|nr:20S proteasome subunit alpha 3 [Nematocida minor]KAI5189218.1 20S proteasome subunit alpha 3 [Nematocida minor]